MRVASLPALVFFALRGRKPYRHQPFTRHFDNVKGLLSAEHLSKIKFHPLAACLILLALMGGMHFYQIKMNPCYQSLRLHVLANSDSPGDQAVKLKVRDAVLRTAGPYLKGVRNQEEAAARAQKILPLIKEAADRTLNREGYHYTSRVYLGTYEFPVRWYGETVFPPGRYQAVRVVLGKGEGHNWWCVLFPPLCLQVSDGQKYTANGLEGSIELSHPDPERQNKRQKGETTEQAVNLRLKTLDWLRWLYRMDNSPAIAGAGRHLWSEN